MNPKMRLFDELAAVLDPEMVGEVLKVIQDLAETEMTKVVVTHKMGFVKEVTACVILMDADFIVKEETPEQIFDHPQLEKNKFF